jgi:hypothetical protein
MRRFVSVTAATAALLATSSAPAVERQHHLTLGPELAILKIDNKSTLDVGGGVAAAYAYGLTDQWNLIAEGAFAEVAANQGQDTPTSPKNRPDGVDRGTVGIGYVVDILRWVPTFSVLAGGYRLHGGTLDGSLILPAASAGLSLDYQLSRKFAIGVSGRQHFFFTKMSTYPSFTTAVLRFEWMWGY